MAAALRRTPGAGRGLVEATADDIVWEADIEEAAFGRSEWGIVCPDRMAAVRRVTSCEGSVSVTEPWPLVSNLSIM